MVNIRSLLYKKLSIIWFQWCKKTWRQHVLDYAAFGTMQLGFIIFYKIISLRSVPHNQARPTANPPSPINCYKQIQNGAVWDLFYARMQCLFYRLGHPPSFYSGVIPGAVINYFALYLEAGSLPRLKLRTDATPFSSQSGEADFPLKRPPSLVRLSLSGFAYKRSCWTGNALESEQTVPACARHIRHGSVS